MDAIHWLSSPEDVSDARLIRDRGTKRARIRTYYLGDMEAMMNVGEVQMELSS